jgi:hypothetical protein
MADQSSHPPDIVGMENAAHALTPNLSAPEGQAQEYGRGLNIRFHFFYKEPFYRQYAHLYLQ